MKTWLVSFILERKEAQTGPIAEAKFEQTHVSREVSEGTQLPWPTVYVSRRAVGILTFVGKFPVFAKENG